MHSALFHLKPFQVDYLAGFSAEGYQITLEDGFTAGRARMRTVIEHDVRQDIGGDEQKITTLDTDIRNVTFKHVLLPVWIAAYIVAGAVGTTLVVLLIAKFLFGRGKSKASPD
jgi:hypothetical protein